MVSKQQNKYNNTTMSVEKEIRANNESLLNMAAEHAKNKTLPLQMSDNVIELIKVQTGLTTEEAIIFWSKSQWFNELFIKKYPDDYFDHYDEIVAASKKYQTDLVFVLKKHRK